MALCHEGVALTNSKVIKTTLQIQKLRFGATKMFYILKVEHILLPQQYARI